MPKGLWHQQLERMRVSAPIVGKEIALSNVFTGPAYFEPRVPTQKGTAVNGFGASNWSQMVGGCS